jgi:riboflavin biosynthesis pyrimidine reductase
MKILFPLPGQDIEVEDVYRQMTLPEPPPDRPYLLLNFVLSVDGQSTLGTRGATGLGSATDHRLMRRLRTVADCLLHGAGTVRADNFPPRVPPDLAEERLSRGLAPQPLGAVVTASGDLSPQSRYFSARPPLVFTTDAARATLAATLGDRAVVHTAGADRVDLGRALCILRTQYGVRVALCEGGPRLAHDLLSAGYLDELFITLAPKLGSDREALRLLEGPAFPPEAPPQLDLVHVLLEGSELFLRYRVSHGGT